MNKFATILLAVILSPLASAASLDVSQPGADSGWFQWTDGLGSDVDFGTTFGSYPYDDLGLDGPAGIIFTVRDGFQTGDEFAPVLDGTQMTWDVSGIDGDGYFYGIEFDFLDPGPHTLDLIVTQDCCGGGAGEWKLVSGPVLPTGTDVPLPAGVWLFGSALLGLTVVRRRSAKS